MKHQVGPRAAGREAWGSHGLPSGLRASPPVPPRPGLRGPSGVAPKPPASPGTGTRGLSWGCLTPRHRGSSDEGGSWPGKCRWEPRSGQALGKQVSSLRGRTGSLSGDDMQVRRWARQPSRGLPQAHGMRAGALRHVRRGQRGMLSSDCSSLQMPRRSKPELNKEGKKPQEQKR